MFDAPLLGPQEWLKVIDTAEEGEQITAPLGLTPFIKGAVTALGAETSVGKTAMGLQCFRWVIDNGHTGAYCTLEMSPALLFRRFWPQFGSEEECRDWISTTGAHVSHSYLDYQEVEAIIRSDFDFVVIDHIHEIPFDGHEELSRKVKRIASLAPETNTAILMLSQMKQPDPFEQRPPSLYDYSWTKAIPEVSSVCQAIWRPDDDPNLVEVLTLKNRFGPLNSPLSLELDKKTITFQASL